MKELRASDLTFLGIAASDTERYIYGISDELGKAFAAPDEPPCDGTYALVFTRRQFRGKLLSVQLHVENSSCGMETTLIEGVDYGRKNFDGSEREAYAAACS